MMVGSHTTKCWSSTPEAVPEDPHRGEDDQEPVNELRDPVPELCRQRSAASRRCVDEQHRDNQKQ